jgi:TolB-like protein/DNA-binding winged helix-turn-helix (wHTH) protein/Flp pilus assembly protein TadD
MALRSPLGNGTPLGTRLEVAMQEGDPSRRLRFGIFEVDLRTGELTKRGSRLRLQEQPFRVLVMLLERPGRLMTREELHSRLWSQTVVDFDHGLNKAISKIREVLGDSVESPRFVETVPRRGYRFLADVAVIDAPDGRVEPASGDLAAPNRDQVSGGNVSAFRSPAPLPAAVSPIFDPLRHTPSRICSLAVLPLENISGDASQDYFADGMTDELITHLAQISSLRVISRTSAMSYKNVRRPLPEIARELNVEAVVEGTVLRSDQRVRIRIQLIDAPCDKHIWTASYEEDVRDTLALQNRLARAIVEQIKAKLNPQERAALKKSKAVNPAAYEDYLKGRYFWNKRTGDSLRMAIGYFSEAIAKDPNYAEPYSGLADAYALSGDWQYGILSPQDAFPKAKEVATRALTLDDKLGEAHTSLAFALDLGWEWKAAEHEYKRAIALNPGYATAHHWHAWHLIVMGRHVEALAELRKAESLDPLSLIINTDLADALCIARLYDDSIRQSRKALELDPNFALAHYQLGQALEQKHMHDDAIAAFRRAIELSGDNAALGSALAHAYAVSGRKQDAIKMAEDLATDPSRLSSTDANIALIYVGLEDRDQAMIWLEKAYQTRFNPSILLRPGFDPLRPEVQFQDLLRRIGIPISQVAGS